MNFYPVYIYFGLVFVVTLLTLGVSGLFPSYNSTPTKYLPYESGIKTKTNLFEKRFPLRHYLIALMFLVLDIEVVFLYPWAVIAKQMGSFAFYEMAFFLIAIIVGFIYIWKKGGLQWE
jgi:NADH:ubiquinone oxidoreductase subunit 3 (subunit A)